MREVREPIPGAAEAVEEAQQQLEQLQTQPQPDAVVQPDLKVLLVNGPNLNLLGSRQPEIYGSMTFKEIEERVAKRAMELEVEVLCFQSNHEGEIIDFIQREAPTATGIIINPGALSHYSLALRDVLEAVNRPTIEVHVSNIHSREQFRRRTVTGQMADAVITGLGWHGYLIALEALLTIPVTRKERH